MLYIYIQVIYVCTYICIVKFALLEYGTEHMSTTECLPSLQQVAGEVRESVDTEQSDVPRKRWQFWKQSGEKKPQKFGWIMGVLVSHITYLLRYF